MKPRRLAALGAAVLAAVVLFVSDPVLGASASGPHEPRTPIKHFIVLMQEDHTFDNYFGTYPGADGIPAGTRMPLDPLLGKRPFALPFHLTDEPLLQMSHGKDAALAAWREGRMDGFLAAQSDLRGDARRLPMGFYDRHDLPYYWKVAEDYVLFDRFFSSAMGGSYLNHVYWVAGGPGNVDEAVPDGGLDVLTIFDRLQRAGVSWKFYVQDYDPSVTYRTPLRLRHPDVASQTVRSPLLTIPRFLDDPALRSRIVDLDEYYKDLRNGTLPEVAYIAPAGGSEHPPGSSDGRAAHRARAAERPDGEQRVVELRLPAHLRRLGRLVRPRPPAEEGMRTGTASASRPCSSVRTRGTVTSTAPSSTSPRSSASSSRTGTSAPSGGSTRRPAA